MRSRNIANNIIAGLFLFICMFLCMVIAPNKLQGLIVAVKGGEFDHEFALAYENDINENFPWKDFFVDVNGLVHRLLLKREMNGVILMNNGMETEPVPDVEDRGIVANADAVKGLSDWLGEKGIHFLYCQIPWKTDDGNNLLPAGQTDYSDRIANEFIKNLKERDVNYLDLRECIMRDGVDRDSLYLKTEHHWSPYGGFYAFCQICDYLKSDFGEEIPEYVTNLDNYEQKTYYNGSLGYYGQRVGWMFGGFDDFTLIYPGWETKQSSWAPHKELLREGSFYDAIFYTEYLEVPWRERGLYHTYIGGDWPVVEHHSETAPVDKTVMILIDSFGIIPESFLTTVYKNVIALDLRWVFRNNTGKTTVDYVEEYHPDIVIVMFNPNQIGYPDSEQFRYGIEEAMGK